MLFYLPMKARILEVTRETREIPESTRTERKYEREDTRDTDTHTRIGKKNKD